jgi:phosphoserine phosphatase RsbU/P
VPPDLEPEPPSPEALALLARASGVLAGSLNLERTIERFLDLFVPDVARWAQIGLVNGDDHALTRMAKGAEGLERRRWAAPSGTLASLGGIVATGRRLELPAAAAPDLRQLVPAEWLDEASGLAEEPALALALRARGTVFGSLVLTGLAPRMPTAHVEEVAARAARAVDVARLYRDRSRIARVLQDGLRPAGLPSVPGLRMALFQRPADQTAGLGGDFIDVHGGDGDWTITIGDVAGHGVEAAVLMGKARQSIRTAALVDRSPSAILELLNEVLVRDEPHRFVTVVCGRLRPTGGGWRLDASAAGHPPPLLLRADGRVATLGVRGTVVGAVPDRRYEEETVMMGPGDTCLLYTDGLTEARDADGELFGEDRVASLLGEMVDAQPRAVVDHLAHGALEHSGGRAQDDLALLAIRVDA